MQLLDNTKAKYRQPEDRDKRKTDYLGELKYRACINWGLSGTIVTPPTS